MRLVAQKGRQALTLRRFCRRQGCEALVPYDRAVLGLAMDTNRKAPLCARTVENSAKAYPALREAALLPFPAAICVEMRRRCLRVLCQPGLTISCCRTNGGNSRPSGRIYFSLWSNPSPLWPPAFRYGFGKGAVHYLTHRRKQNPNSSPIGKGSDLVLMVRQTGPGSRIFSQPVLIGGFELLDLVQAGKGGAAHLGREG